jgi:hypothetical protein
MPENLEPSPLGDALRDLDNVFGKDRQVRNVEFTPETCPGLVSLIRSWLPVTTGLHIDQVALESLVRHVLEYGADRDEHNGLSQATAAGRRREADRVGVRSYLYLSRQPGESGAPINTGDRITLWKSDRAESPLMASKILRGRWASTQAKRYYDDDPIAPILSDRSGNAGRDQYFRRLTEDFEAFVLDRDAVRKYRREITVRSAEPTSKEKSSLELTVRIPRRVVDAAPLVAGLLVAVGAVALLVSILIGGEVDVRLQPALSETAAPTPQPSGWTVGWGPARELYDGHKDNAAPAFNNLASSDVGDQRNFVQIRNIQDDTPAGWSDNVWAEPGQAYVMRIFITNSATDGKSGKENVFRQIKDVRLVLGQSRREGGVDIYATLSASNATSVYDGASIHVLPEVQIKFDTSTLRILKSSPALASADIDGDVFSHSGGRLVGGAGTVTPGGQVVVEVTLRATN